MRGTICDEREIIEISDDCGSASKESNLSKEDLRYQARIGSNLPVWNDAEEWNGFSSSSSRIPDDCLLEGNSDTRTFSEGITISVNPHPAVFSKREPPDPNDIKNLTRNGNDFKNIPRLNNQVPSRVRKQDPLPYSMEWMKESEKRCRYCGPPFEIVALEEMRMWQPCSFECAKRYLVETHCKQYGFNLTHYSSVPETHGRGTFLGK